MFDIDCTDAISAGVSTGGLVWEEVTLMMIEILEVGESNVLDPASPTRGCDA
jgi:hypothetical protein